MPGLGQISADRPTISAETLTAACRNPYATPRAEADCMNTRLDRILARLAVTHANIEHPLRRMREAIGKLEAAGLLDQRAEIIALELEVIEAAVHQANDALDHLALRITDQAPQ
jgi:hypothetical protein